MQSRNRWQIYTKKKDESLIEHLCRIRHLTVADLKADYELHLHDPMLLPGMKEARSLIVDAVNNKTKIAIFGDYDADGTPAAAMLSSLCQKLGVESEVFLPTRATGYGLSQSYIDPIAKSAKLLITVDTGINSVEEIKLIKSKGVKVIVLDHHLPQDELPAADALVDPFLKGSKYPFPNICGCTLAFKLVQALQKDFPDKITDGFIKWQLDLVALSTVTDMMPLYDENRTLVTFGLKVLAKTKRPGLVELMLNAGLDQQKLTAGSIGYSIGPRLNAAGRMGDNTPVIELLTTLDKSRARIVAAEIEGMNRRRQDSVEELVKQVEKTIFKQNLRDDFVYVVYGASWPAGILGLVAGKFTEKYNRAVIIGSLSGDSIKASARSTEHYPIIEGLTESSKFLTQFGGHRQAAGLSAEAKNWPEFVDTVKAHARKYLNNILPLKTLKIDAELEMSQVDLKTITKIQELEPYGLGNSKPLFLLRDVKMSSVQTIGAKKNHVRLTLESGQSRIQAVAFSFAERFENLKLDAADVVGYISENSWQNQTTPQFQLIDFMEAGHQIEEIDV